MITNKVLWNITNTEKEMGMDWTNLEKARSTIEKESAGSRRRECPRKTWKRVEHEEDLRVGNTWNEVKTLAVDRKG